MHLINLTPHPITIEGVGTLSPSGHIARVQALRKERDRLSSSAVPGVRVVDQAFGEVYGMPAVKVNAVYIVSGMVLDALKKAQKPGFKEDFVAGWNTFAPDTGADAIRNQEGVIVSVKGLVA